MVNKEMESLIVHCYNLELDCDRQVQTGSISFRERVYLEIEGQEEDKEADLKPLARRGTALFVPRIRCG